MQRVQVAQQHIGIGYRSVLAAQPVAGGARVGAGAQRPDAQGAAAVHGGDATAASADLCQVNGRDAQDVAAAAQQPVADADAAADLVFRCLEHLTVLDDGGLGGGATHVQGHQVGHLEATSQVEGPHHAGCGAGLDAVDRALHGDAGGGEAAVGLHDGQGHGDSHLLQPLDQQAKVTLHHRADVAVDDGGAGALVLLHLRQQVGGQRQDQIRRTLAHRLGHGLLVVGVGVGMQQAHGDRLDTAVHNRLRGALDRGGVEGAQHLAAEVEALADFQAVLSFHQRRRLLVVQIVEARRAVAPELEDIAKTLCGYQGHVSALFLDDGIGGNGEPVADLGDIGGIDGQLLDARANTVEHRTAVVVGRAGHLAGKHAPVVAEEYDVGESAADVYAYTEFWHYFALIWSCREDNRNVTLPGTCRARRGRRARGSHRPRMVPRCRGHRSPGSAPTGLRGP